ncbi:L-lactate dehydrogenase [Rhodovulum sp. 12E13]|uniref:L-lactate dehydrogenase n=1 Tax=Rhodovulum sp. 12E13 TaxID=2203891 RepID=UPI000E124B96|nr:L-lactate dehydrogenase [Rhodovulum sp. 12E13]RDC74130.1 L-lactate dehydrogenase [Rhodovulum sp. 12E13]
MKVGIVGAGAVGATAAYAIGLMRAAQEVVLVDRSAALAEAQAADILHAMPFTSPARVSAGGYEALADAGIVILAAGVNQQPGESRLALLSRNAAVFEDVIGQVLSVVPDPILVIATNPVDIMTTVALRLSGLKASRVIGSGTILDTARFRSLLAGHLGVSSRSIHAYVLGEHGDSEVLGWSGARVGTMPLEAFAAQVRAPITRSVRETVDEGVRRAAYRIISGKGATNYGIGGGLARIVSAIAQDERAVLSLSAESETLTDYPRVAFSLPRLIGAEGLVAELSPSLDANEAAALRASADLLKQTADAL